MSDIVVVVAVLVVTVAAVARVRSPLFGDTRLAVVVGVVVGGGGIIFAVSATDVIVPAAQHRRH